MNRRVGDESGAHTYAMSTICFQPSMNRSRWVCERQTINTNIRLNLADEDDRRAMDFINSL